MRSFLKALDGVFNHLVGSSDNKPMLAAEWRVTAIADREKKEFLFNDDQQRIAELPFCPKSLYTMRHSLKKPGKYKVVFYYEGEA